MPEFRYWNENPQNERREDCVTRAICFATGFPYEKVRKKLFHTAKLLECSKLCPTCYSFAIQEVFGGTPVDCHGLSVGEFADKHPIGTYLIRIYGHLTAIRDGAIYDTWDCRNRECDIAWKIYN